MIPEIKEADKLIDEINNTNWEKAHMLYAKATRVTSSFKRDNVQSSVPIHSREDVLLELAEITRNYELTKKKIKELYNRLEDRNLKIYFDRKFFHLSLNDLELKYGIGKRQIQRIIKKIEENSKMSP